MPTRTETSLSAPVDDVETPSRRTIIRLDDVAAASDLSQEWVAIPEWAPLGADESERAGYGVYVRTLSGKERATWQQVSILGTGNKTAINFQQTTVKLVIMAAIDDQGRRVFSDAHSGMLLGKNSAVLERIADVAMRLSGITEEEVESVTGKGLTTDDGSSTDSP